MFAPLKTETGWSVKTELLKSPCGPALMAAAKMPGRSADNLTEPEAVALAEKLNRWYYSQTAEKKRRASDD